MNDATRFFLQTYLRDNVAPQHPLAASLAAVWASTIDDEAGDSTPARLDGDTLHLGDAKVDLRALAALARAEPVGAATALRQEVRCALLAAGYSKRVAWHRTPATASDLDDATAREVLLAAAQAIIDGEGLTGSTPDVVALQLDQHVANLCLRVARQTRERDAARKDSRELRGHLHAWMERAGAAEKESEARRVALLTVGEERRAEWQRAETAEAEVATLRDQLQHAHTRAADAAETERLAEERRGKVLVLMGELDSLRARAEADEVALRAAALWLGGPHQPSQPDDVAALARAKGAELDALRAIIEGRAVAPTDAEARALDAAGGHWLYLPARGTGTCPCSACRDAQMPVGELLPGNVRAVADAGGGRWWALDADRKPCAWPVAPKVNP